MLRSILVAPRAANFVALASYTWIYVNLNALSQKVMIEFDQIFTPSFTQVYDDEFEAKALRNFADGLDK